MDGVLYPKTSTMAHYTFHAADTRGMARHGWLTSAHTFSFAHYYDPERVHFGALRVLNDDLVAPGMGFGEHPHNNMEIISIPLEGALEHRDSMGNKTVIRNGDVQVMSAGTGVRHSEFNHSKSEAVKFLQIWVFPNKRDVAPRYDQVTLPATGSWEGWKNILGPTPAEGRVWIHQDAWFHIGRFQANEKSNYTIQQSGNGVYVFVLAGSVNVDGHALQTRDGLGIENTEHISFEITSPDTQILLMEVPMDENKIMH